MVWPKCSDPADPNLLLEEPPVEEQLEASWKTLKGEDLPLELPRLSKEELRKFEIGRAHV